MGSEAFCAGSVAGGVLATAASAASVLNVAVIVAVGTMATSITMGVEVGVGVDDVVSLLSVPLDCCCESAVAGAVAVTIEISS